MKFLELLGGISLPVSIEEGELVQRLTKNKINIMDLNERDRTLSKKLYSRGVLDKIEENDELHYYVLRKLEDL